MIRWARTVHSWLCSLFYRGRMGSPEWFVSAVIAGCVCWWFEHAGSWGVWCPASNRTAPSVDGSLELVSFFFLSKPAISLHLDHDLNNVIDIWSCHFTITMYQALHFDYLIVIILIKLLSLLSHRGRYHHIANAIIASRSPSRHAAVANTMGRSQKSFFKTPWSLLSQSRSWIQTATKLKFPVLLQVWFKGHVSNSPGWHSDGWCNGPTWGWT